LLAVFGLVVFGLVVFGFVPGAVLLAEFAGGEAPGVGVGVGDICPDPAVLPLAEAGVAGDEAGNVVRGVGSGGSGLESTLAIISGKPSVVLL
jgi:hypothetical protein